MIKTPIFTVQRMISAVKILKFDLTMLLLILALLTCNYNLVAQSSFTINLQDSIQKIITDKKIPGLQVAVVSKDSILFQGCFGYADIAQQIPVTPQHLFKIGSVTKSFTALAIMTLVNQGKLNLADKLKEVVPEIVFENEWAATHPVLIKHLLEHKAGFDDMHFNTFGKESWDGITAQEAVEVYQQSLKSRWQPGLVHSYSNPSYVVLGHVIEKVSKMSYQQYIAQHVLQPLKMEKTLFSSELQHTTTNSLATGYRLKEGQHEKVKNKLSIGETGGALLSNLEDMIHFVQFFLNEETQNTTLHLGNSTVQEMEKVHSWFEKENNIQYGYGYGLDNIDTEVDGVYFTGHSGGVWGFTAHFLYNKEYDLGISIVNNGGATNRQIRTLLLAHFLKEKNIKQPKKTVAKNEPISSDWDGHYYPINERNGIFTFINWPFNTLQLEANRDSLGVHYFLEGTAYYRPYQGNAFIDKGETTPGIYLTTTNGKKSLYYYGSYYEPISGVALYSFKVIMSFTIIGGVLLVLLSFFQLIGSFFKPHWRTLSKFTFSLALPALLFISSIFLLASNGTLDGIIKMGQINATTISIFLLTLLLPFVSLFGLIYLFKNRSFISSKLLFALYTSTALSSLFLVGYCIRNDWFAMQLWTY